MVVVKVLEFEQASLSAQDAAARIFSTVYRNLELVTPRLFL